MQVKISGEPVAFTTGQYALDYTQPNTDDWQYAVLTDWQADLSESAAVETVLFQLSFDPNETLDIEVSYPYRLGGYPDYNFNVKRGELEYFLTPAALWKDFGGLTIELYLDKDMPVLKASSLDFEKVAARHYRYTSDQLPNEDLWLLIDENWWQNILSTLRSPYLPMMLPAVLPFLLVFLVLVVCIIRFFYKKKKRHFR